MATQPWLLPVASSTLSTNPSIFHHPSQHRFTSSLFNCNALHHRHHLQLHHRRLCRRICVGIEDTEPPFGGGDNYAATATAAEEVDDVDPTPEDLEYISQIKRVLELLKKNRDMLFGEVKLTISIEDPRELERRRLLGIDDSDGPSREDLVAALEEVCFCRLIQSCS
ncbi:hypothetical protein RND81_01G077500 [Saponaria officinalis]|uniref:Uncharacterized protein n=1 Tax=Saponaria officinalis TaxID=3572 RepID=A0AAW1NCD9_SAPOF